MRGKLLHNLHCIGVHRRLFLLLLVMIYKPTYMLLKKAIIIASLIEINNAINIS